MGFTPRLLDDPHGYRAATQGCQTDEALLDFAHDISSYVPM